MLNEYVRISKHGFNYFLIFWIIVKIFGVNISYNNVDKFIINMNYLLAIIYKLYISSQENK